MVQNYNIGTENSVQTRRNTWFHFSKLFIVGNTKEDKVLFLIIKYPPVFAAFPKRIIRYYSVLCKQNS